MPIVEADLSYRYTGATSHDAAQTDPDLSLGDYRSTSVVPPAAANNVFDDVSGEEANAGMTDYRAIGFLNSNATLALSVTRIWLASNTGNSEDEVSFDAEAPSDPVDGYVQAIANENSAPVGLPGWSVATTKATGKDCPLSNGIVGAGEWFAVWYRRTITSFASAKTNETVTIRVEGDTPA